MVRLTVWKMHDLLGEVLAEDDSVLDQDLMLRTGPDWAIEVEEIPAGLEKLMFKEE